MKTLPKVDVSELNFDLRKVTFEELRALRHTFSASVPPQERIKSVRKYVSRMRDKELLNLTKSDFH